MATSIIDEFSKQFDRVLILGGSGFIGSRVGEILVAHGIEVFSTYRASTNDSPKPPSSSYGPIQLELRSSDEISEIIEKTQPQLIINLATFFTKRDDKSVTQPLIDSNVALVAHVAQSCAINNVPLVQAQSAWQFNSQGILDPQTPYFLYKQIGQEICEWYGLKQGLRVNFVRFFDTYGPNDPRKKIVNLLISAFENSEELDLSGGMQLVNLLHVDDAAMGVLASSLSFKQGSNLETYWCSGQSDLNLKDLVDYIANLYVKSPTINWGVVPYRLGEIFQPWSFEMKPPPYWTRKIDLQHGLAALTSHH